MAKIEKTIDINVEVSEAEKALNKFGKSIESIREEEFEPLNFAIGELLQKELSWEDGGKHSVCVAESFSNYIRENRHGYSRSVAHMSNMVRAHQIGRDEALSVLCEEDPGNRGTKVDKIVDRLNLSEQDLETIINVEPMKYEMYSQKRYRVIDKLMKIIDKVIGY